MENDVTLNGRKIKYQFKKSPRAKQIRIIVHHDTKVVITAPKRLSSRLINRFLESKKDWLLEKIDHLSSSESSLLSKCDRNDYLKNREKARALVLQRIEHFNGFYRYPYNRVSIKNQTSRWGSCSAKKNLNFNYKLIYLSPEQLDYIVVHELCHLKEMNHSKNFWSLVAKTIPDYVKIRKTLKNTV